MLDKSSIQQIANNEYHRVFSEEGIVIPDNVKADLMLGITTRGNDVVYTVYQPGDRPEDALFFATITVDRATGACEVTVEKGATPFKTPK